MSPLENLRQYRVGLACVSSLLKNVALIGAFLFCFAGHAYCAETALKESSLTIPEGIEKNLKIRVAIGNPMQRVVVSTDTPFKVFDGTGRPLFSGDRIGQSTIVASGEKVLFGRQSFKDQPVVLNSLKSLVTVDKRTYRDIIEFTTTGDGKLRVINQLDLEDYLRGVLPSEANPSWKESALKAQAVVSRTYALFKMIENSGDSYAVSSDVLSQVYGGVTLEKRSTNAAIDATAGEILVYKNKIFPAYFHSTCGGATTRTENAWPVKPHPVLRGGSCGFCNESPHYRWKAVFTEQELIGALKKSGRPVSAITRIEAVDTDESGRPKFFQIEHPAGKVKIPSNDFRLAVSPMKMKSVFIQRIVREGSSFQFVGRGWGHGVGMCQYGDKKMAELGYDYRQILQYYFPGSEIKKLELAVS